MSQLSIAKQARLEQYVVTAVEEGWTIERLAQEAGVGFDSAQNRLQQIRTEMRENTKSVLVRISQDAGAVLTERANGALRLIKELPMDNQCDDQQLKRLDGAIKRLQTLMRMLNMRGDALPGNLLHVDGEVIDAEGCRVDPPQIVTQNCDPDAETPRNEGECNVGHIHCAPEGGGSAPQGEGGPGGAAGQPGGGGSPIPPPPMADLDGKPGGGGG